MNYAQAEDAAALINGMISGGSVSGLAVSHKSSSSSTSTSTRPSIPPPTGAPSGGVPGGESTGLLQYSSSVRILPDPRTNSLLVMATKEDLARIEALINSIDTPVAQVLIEVVIGEVEIDNDLSVGVNLVKRLARSGDINSIGGTSTGGTSPAPSPTDLSGFNTGTGLAPVGATLASTLTYYATFKNLGLDAAVQLLASTSNFKTLSTPIIMTLHNKEADIVVGESLPVITATIAGVSTVSVSNQVANALQSNVEYKDVAIELKVTPLINPDGYVTMEIDQKVNDLGGNVNIQGTQQPIITKREAKASVMVKDRSTVVLGGLIKEENGITESKVPFLGDIPFIGHLFKNKENTKVRTELIVFLRPTVIRTSAAAVDEAQRRTHMMKDAKDMHLENALIGQAWSGQDAPPPAKAASTNTTWSTDSPERKAAKVKALMDQDPGTTP